MRWLGLAIVASLLAFVAPAFAQTPPPQPSPSASAEPVIEVTVGPRPDVAPSDVPVAATPSPSPSPMPVPTPRTRRGSRSKALPSPSATPSPSPSPTPIPSPAPVASPSPPPPQTSATYKPIYYHGVPIYPKPGYGLPSDAVPLVPAAQSTATPKPAATAVREKYYWGVPTPTPVSMPPAPASVALPPVAPSAPPRTPMPARMMRTAPPVDDVLLDRSSTLIGGSWSCMSFGGTPLYHRYTHSDDGNSIDVATTFVLPEHKIGKAKETYRFKRATLLWLAKLADGSIVASAPPWIGVTWTFTGSARGEDKRVSGFRMIYTWLGENVFRRDFERPDDVGSWSVYAGETCRRAVVGSSS